MDIAGQIKTEAHDMLSKMISTFTVDVAEDMGIYHVTIQTEDAATVIGRHGETIRAIQKILEVYMYKATGESVQILVDVNDFREKQEEKLNDMIEDAVSQVKAEGRPGHLRGLSSYERKMVHTYITEKYPDLSTYSIGSGRDRHLIIDVKGEADNAETTSEPTEETEATQ